MAKYNERNTEVRSHGFEDSKALEAELKQLRLLDWDEAMWRLQHEEKIMMQWVKDRFAFMKAELEKARPTMPKFKPVYDGPPIVTHRIGRGINNTQYGERFG